MKELEVFLEEEHEDSDLLLMRVALSGDFMKQTEKKFPDKTVLMRQTPCCSHGYFDYYERAEAVRDIVALIEMEHYVILGEDWGEFMLIYGYEGDVFSCVFPQKKGDVYVPVVERLSLLEILTKVGYVEAGEEKRIQVSTMKKNVNYGKKGIFRFFCG